MKNNFQVVQMQMIILAAPKILYFILSLFN